MENEWEKFRDIVKERTNDVRGIVNVGVKKLGGGGLQERNGCRKEIETHMTGTEVKPVWKVKKAREDV